MKAKQNAAQLRESGIRDGKRKRGVGGNERRIKGKFPVRKLS